MRRWLLGSFVLFSPLLGCGDCGESPPAGEPNGEVAEADDAAADGSGSDDTEQVTDADGPVDAADSATDGEQTTEVDVPVDSGDSTVDSTDGADRCSSGERFCGGTCVDRHENPDHCGACGNTCRGGEICREGTCRCPRYQERCGGECVSVNVDPDNCGRCGNECSGEQACSAGTCSSECLPGRERCGSTCADRATDDRHCGGCNESCGDGEGCVDGTCEETIALDSAPDKCAGGGPPIEVAPGEDDRTECLGDVAERTFRWGICSCDDLKFGNKLISDAYDSTLGRYESGGLGGSIGTNGRFHATDQTSVWGATWTSSPEGMQFDNKTTIEQELHSGGDAVFDNDTTVGGDARVEGDIGGKGDVQFEQQLVVGANSELGENVGYNRLDRRNVDVPTVCGRCEDSQRIPVSSIVAAHSSAANNDNDAVGLDADVLDQPGRRVSLELPCGEYYLSNIDTERKLSIVAKGRTALYVDGDVWAKNKISITPEAGAELDLFVAGNVELENDAAVGSPAFPASMRVYVGGDQGWVARNKLDFGAYVYALPGGIEVANKLEVFGGLYTSRLQTENDVTVHYDRSVLQAGRDCSNPPPTPPGSGGDAGDGGTGDGVDAGGKDAADGSSPPGETCGGEGDGCEANGDCCSPLICTDDGVCGSASCSHRYETCASDDECCSGTCDKSAEPSICVGS